MRTSNSHGGAPPPINPAASDVLTQYIAHKGQGVPLDYSMLTTPIHCVAIVLVL